MGDCAVHSGLIPMPYRSDGFGTDVYRVPVHFVGDALGLLCPMGGKDAMPGELDHCPYHGAVAPLCEANPDHLMHRVPAVIYIATTADPALPACQECAPGAILSQRMLM